MATRSRRTLILSAAIVVLGLSCSANAEDYPARPVRIVVSFSAGGPTDIVGRVIAQKLSELFGQQFFVENKVGAGGNIGADLVAKSPPDGYTLLVATVSTHAINPGLYSKMPYDPVRDFAPIAQVGVTPPQGHTGFSKSIFRFDPNAQSWETLAEELPAPRVTVPCVRWKDLWIIPSGEMLPGVRSPQVWAFTPARRQ